MGKLRAKYRPTSKTGKALEAIADALDKIRHETLFSDDLDDLDDAPKAAVQYLHALALVEAADMAMRVAMHEADAAAEKAAQAGVK